jgi:hypothetical protein
MAWTWTKTFSTLDDGTILSGIDLQNLQSDIVNNAVDVTSTQTIAGTKNFTGSINMSGTIANVPKISEYVFYEDNLVSWDDEAIYYQ